MAKKKKTKKQLTIHSTETKVLIGLLTMIGGIAVAIAPFTDGAIFGQITQITGEASVVYGALILFISLRILIDKPYFNSIRPIVGLTLLSLTASVFLTFIMPDLELSQMTEYSAAGGILGYSLHTQLFELVGALIEFLILLLASVLSFSLLTGVSLEKMKDGVENSVDGFSSALSKLSPKEIKRQTKDIDIVKGTAEKEVGGKAYIGNNQEQGQDQDSDFEIANSTKAGKKQKKGQQELPMAEEITSDKTSYIGDSNPVNTKPKTSNDEEKKDEDPFGEPMYENWQYPPSKIYQEPVSVEQDEKVHKRNAIVIEKTLKSFGIETRISKITIGPTVVQYALSITVGTKVSKIKNLSTDLALALATSESLVRIEAPIPGTSYIGIEIPNPTPEFVYIKEMVEDLRQKSDKYQLPLILGKNVAGEPVIKDLATLPHLLVAGATGSGKSIGVNSILTGLLMTKSPDELKLILVDPKMVEMAPYNGIPYLLTPVITDMELVVNALQWAIEEMTRRYRTLKQVGVKNIKEYNKKIGYTGMPYIVIIIDEMADLMLSTGADVETKIVRLAQMARAVGMHLILATQRPSVDVITGIIKANVPGRMAFAVSASIDSRVIIDQPGAESLIGKGDMLFRSPELGKPIRIQGAFTATSDTENLITFIKAQVDEDNIEYMDEVTQSQEDDKKGKNGTGSEFSDDELFEDAVRIVVNSQKASASMLQRRLRIGYNRAARIVDEMFDAKIIGPQQGSTPRKVLIANADSLFGDDDAEGEDSAEQIAGQIGADNSPTE